MMNVISLRSELSSLTKVLKTHRIPVSAKRMNELLVEHGYLLKLRRPSMKDGVSIRSFYVLSGKGLMYGENIRSVCHPVQTEPRYQADLALPLLLRMANLLTTPDKSLPVLFRRAA